ncbi:MAG: Tic22 family protein [Cyanobacteria bacterium P01_A01_bin.123]
MKSFLQKALTLGLMATISMGAIFFNGFREMPALALPPAEIVQILSTVPVFIIVNGEGAPLTTAQSQNGQQSERLVVFIYGSDAEAYLANQDSLAEARVASVWLSDLYERTQTQNSGGSAFAYIPNGAAVEAANELDEEFERGVPLFVARQDSGYLFVRQEDEQRVPMFFSRADLQNLLDRLEQSSPEAAAAVFVDVIPLENVIRAMESDDAAALSQIRLFPASEVIDYLQN